MPGSVNQRTKIKILFITKWYPNRYDPQMGVFVRKHASAVAQFCDVALLHVFSDTRMENITYELVSKKEYGINSVIVYFRKSQSSFSFVNKIVNFLRYCKATSKGLKHIRKTFGEHDITHAYILLRPAMVAYLLKLWRRKPFVVSEQWSGFASGKFNEKKWIVKQLSMFVGRKAEVILSVSEFLKSKMIANGLKGNYAVIPNIVEPLASKVPHRSQDHVVILVVADLVDEIKNVSGTLKAFAELIPSHSDLKLYIIGDGRDREKLEELASDLNLLNEYVFFQGLKSNEEVYQGLVNCDFLVMNSYVETFSLICAEAISCGKPVIATRCGGPQEFVTEETGILIDPGNHAQLISALKEMIHGYRDYSPDKLKHYAQQKFSAESTGELFLHLYQDILSDSNINNSFSKQNRS